MFGRSQSIASSSRSNPGVRREGTQASSCPSESPIALPPAGGGPGVRRAENPGVRGTLEPPRHVNTPPKKRTQASGRPSSPPPPRRETQASGTLPSTPPANPGGDPGVRRRGGEGSHLVAQRRRRRLRRDWDGPPHCKEPRRPGPSPPPPPPEPRPHSLHRDPSPAVPLTPEPQLPHHPAVPFTLGLGGRGVWEPGRLGSLGWGEWGPMVGAAGEPGHLACFEG